LLPEGRATEQRRAHAALYGEGGFSSWERILEKAAPENKPPILRNALLQLYPLAAKAGISHIEISDWAASAGDAFEVGDPDQIQRIIVDAKVGAEKAEAKPAAHSVSGSDRLRPLDLQEFLQLAIKQREMLLDPILPEKGLAMLYAARGTGKTHVALGICFAAATATKFLRWTAPKSRQVLLVDGEMPAAALQERLAGVVASAPDVKFDSKNIKI